MFHRPTTFEEALAVKARLGGQVVPIAGGTDLVVTLNRGVPCPADLLDLSAVKSYDRIEQDNGHLLLSAGATFARLADVEVQCLARAARSVGGPQVRNRGTIGGNLATASPAGDGCVALLALDADVEISHAERGARWLKLADFFLDYKKTDLADDELISRIRIPSPAQLQETAWYKIGKRGAVNIAVVACAAARFADGRIGMSFGSVAPMPLRAIETERLLAGNPLTAELIDQAAAQAMTEVRPIDDWRASADYRRAMCGVLARRLLRLVQTEQERDM